MKLLVCLYILLFPGLGIAQKFTTFEIFSWIKQAENITIIRDQWGIPHIYGKTNADVVFGLHYAQCKDDFPRVESKSIRRPGCQ